MNEYQRKLNEIEKDNENKSKNLRLVIDSLLKEKDELSKRLIKANNEKLFNLIEEKHSSLVT